MTEQGAWVFPGDVANIASKIGSRVMPDNEQWMNRFTVQSTSSNREYVVSQRRSDGTWGCSCPGWRHYRHCKHLTDILGRLAAIPTLSTHSAGNEEMSGGILGIISSARTAFQEHQRR